MMNLSPHTARATYERESLCRSEAQTERLAAAFAAHLTAGEFVALIGPLGAGKSVFARSVGAAWGVAEPMPSPSYTLMAIHPGRLPIYHIDLYRLGSVAELDFAGLTSFFHSDGICLVEWADRVRDRWPSSGWEVYIQPVEHDVRRISISAFGVD